MTNSRTSQKSSEAFRTISEVAEALQLPQHVLRFWETRFVQIKPLKRAGGRRFYRPDDVELLMAIRQLLYGEGYTIRGVQRILKEQGPRAVAALARGGVIPPAQTLPHHDQTSLHDAIETPAMTSSVFAYQTMAPDTRGADDVAPEAFAPMEAGEWAGDQAYQAKNEPDRGAIIDRLRGVMMELSECRRILMAARG
ncbi:MerR family transcriptional regulator [Lichenihabitans sp. PAMC28606]|uniref:MerR family transcriptional regulator n=1 Tax=Lichenihabitans sp. PAMC28606 TaxID=2880932 RepID=UPI001D0A1580|nr:MerR family transcriptional regulator [Lichenihabitans sp. PAMC28606]UDL95082.1 MerR family transcriptional regulator [Lichenihabitans sp. PAMC28606]